MMGDKFIVILVGSIVSGAVAFFWWGIKQHLTRTQGFVERVNDKVNHLQDEHIPKLEREQVVQAERIKALQQTDTTLLAELKSLRDALDKQPEKITNTLMNNLKMAGIVK